MLHLEDARGLGHLGSFSAFGVPLMVSPKATFSRTVMCGKIA
jgi:hypothetical protein